VPKALAARRGLAAGGASASQPAAVGDGSSGTTTRARTVSTAGTSAQRARVSTVGRNRRWRISSQMTSMPASWSSVFAQRPSWPPSGCSAMPTSTTSTMWAV
jgi:hypothetical protein